MTLSDNSRPGEPDTGPRRDECRSWTAIARPFVIAHRFGNSLPALAEAAALGVQVVEADIWLYRSRLEVRHSKTAGRLPILWDRWALERGWKPRLELATLLEHVPPHMIVMLDVKGGSQGLPAAIMRLTRDRDWDRPLLVCSQNWAHLERFRQQPEVTLVHSIGNHRQLTRSWSRLARDDHDAVSIHVRLLNREIVRALKSLVSVVISWPINDPTTAQRLLDWGVDGLTTDVPVTIQPIIGS